MDPVASPPPTTPVFVSTPEAEPKAPELPSRKRAIPPEIRIALSIFLLASGTIMSLLLIIAGKLSPPDNQVLHNVPQGTITRTLTQPPLVPMLAVGLVLIVMTSALWWYAKNILRLSKPTLFLTILYSSLIIITKFIVSPYMLYKEIIRVDQGGLGFSVSFDPSQIAPLIISAFGVLGLYLFAYTMIYKFFQKKLTREFNEANGIFKPEKELTAKRMIGITAVVLCIVVGGGFSILIISSLILTSSVQYIAYVIGGSILLLAGALLAAISAFANSYEDAKQTASIMTLSSFFFIGLVMLLSIHILWVVYMAILAVLWPFNITYYSSK